MWTFIIDTVHLAYLKWRPCLRFRSQNSGRMQTLIGKLSHRGSVHSACVATVLVCDRNHTAETSSRGRCNDNNWKLCETFCGNGRINELTCKKKLAHILPPIKINLQRYIRNTHHLSRFFSCGTKKTLMPINLWPFFEPLKCPLAPPMKGIIGTRGVKNWWWMPYCNTSIKHSTKNITAGGI